MDTEKNEILTEDSLVTDSPETYKVLTITELGRCYETTFTKKFENRKKWVRPSPEEVRSYLPGTVDKIIVKTGDYVRKDSELMTYVAMKMKNVIRAPFDGIVAGIRVKAGDQLPKGELMLTVKMTSETPKEIKKRVKKEHERNKKITRK